MALQTIVSDVLWNLDIIGSISNHQTLMVDGDRLRFDNRYLQWIRRSVSGDSREQILQAIRNTFSRCEEVVHSYQCNTYVITPNPSVLNEQLEIVSNILDTLQSFITRKSSVVSGLAILSTFERYDSDSAFRIEMSRFMERMQKLCRKCEQIKQTIIQHGIPPPTSGVLPEKVSAGTKDDTKVEAD